MDMPATVLDHFSHVFGDRRGLPKCLRELRRSEDPHIDASLLEILTGGGFSPGESLLIAGDFGSGKSSICHQILAGLIDQGGSCLLVSPSRTSARSASRQVTKLLTSRPRSQAANLLHTFFVMDDKNTYTRLMGAVADYSFVCVDSLDDLASATGSLAPTFSGLQAAARRNGTSLIVTKRTKENPIATYRQQLRSEALIGIPDYVGGVTREGDGLLSWDRLRLKGKRLEKLVPLYFNVQSNAVSPWSPWER